MTSGLDSVIAWSFKTRLCQDIGTQYWTKIKDEITKFYGVSIEEIIRQDYRIFSEKLVDIFGTKGAIRIQRKCLKDILKIEKRYSSFNVSIYDDILGDIVVCSYSDRFKKTILDETSTSPKSLNEIYVKYSETIPVTTFYRKARELIDHNMIVKTGKTRSQKNRIIDRYSSIFSSLTISNSPNIRSIKGTISSEAKESSMILKVLKY